MVVLRSNAMVRLGFLVMLGACAPQRAEPPVPPAPTEDVDETPPPTDQEPPPVDTDSPCTKEECGPAMGMPNSTCPDGKTVAGPVCKRDAAGKCGYTVVECPP
jgi:hypothetical protein